VSAVSTAGDIHPDSVLESLLAKGGRSQRQGNLTKLHEICRKQHEQGSRDFSIPVIGRLCEAQGVLKSRALYNAPSVDYRTLIKVWAAYAGPSTPKAPKKLASHDFLMRIEDVAVRSLVQSAIAERDRLKGQLNILKAHTRVTVDRRPLGATVVSQASGEPVAILNITARLTQSEQEALEKAVSQQFLESQGWREGSHGEIINDKGRTIFEIGYARAIRKVLDK